MRLAAVVHFSAPYRNCGSEYVLHELMKAAAEAGHEVCVWITHRDSEHNWTGNEPDIVFDGVRIVRCKNVIRASAEMVRWRPDVVVSHHQHVMAVIRKARLIGAKSVFLLHNDMDLNQRPLRMRPDLVIYNSDWVEESLQRFGTPMASMTFHPPVTPDRHRVPSTGDAITLCNLNEHKGALLFYDLAAAEPHRKFLGVVGGHGKQVIRRGLPNVTIHEHTPDMRQVWSQTRVLLMPSVYESYGLVAQEAGLNGIPTIAHPTPGLVENLGGGGMFADRDQVDEWRMMLQRLDRHEEYAHASEYALARAGEAMADTQATLKQWTGWLNLL